MLLTNSKNFIYLALALNAHFQVVSGQANSPVTNDFVALKRKLQEYIAQDPDRRIPLLVRNSFHDLFLLEDKASIHGCIAKDDFKNNRENAGLETTIADLQNIVRQNFPNTGFTFGDVVAFSGKIAVESAYPCINIKFKFNRSPCVQEKAENGNEAPSAFIDEIEGLEQMFSYLGGSISPEEMAILFAGAHGIKGARLGPSGWRGVYATFSSGRQFIVDTFSKTWKFINRGTLDQFFTGDNFNPQSSIVRLPTDMIFYPSKVPNGSKKDDSPEAQAIENRLRAFTTQDRGVFDQAFARAYEKMIAIGNGDQDFVETVSTQACPRDPGTTNPPTTTVAPPTTTVAPPTSTVAPPTTTVAPPTTTVAPPTTTVAPPTTTVAPPTKSTSRPTATSTSTYDCLSDDCVNGGSTMILRGLAYTMLYAAIPLFFF